jgi:hypothetical protein
MDVGVIEGISFSLSIQGNKLANAGKLESLKAMALNCQLIAGSSLQKAGKTIGR